MRFVLLLFFLGSCGEVEFEPALTEEAGDKGSLSGDAVGGTADGVDGGRTADGVDGGRIAGQRKGSSRGLQIHTPVVDTSESEITTLRRSETLLDILLVVDNSSSMRRVNETLRTNFSALIPDPSIAGGEKKIGANPWRIAITTSTASECLWSVMNKEDRGIIGHASEFQRTLSSLEFFGSSRTRVQRINTNTEQTVQMATRALAGELAKWDGTQDAGEECAGTARSWLREKSLLAVILISDEDADDKTQPDDRCGGTDATDCLKKLWNKIGEVRVPRRTAEVYAMFHPRDNDVNIYGDPTGSTIYRRWHNRKSDGSFALYKPLFIWNGVVPRGGLVGLELADIANGLQEISARIKQQTQSSYYLSEDNNEDIDRVYLLDGTTKQLLQSDGYHIEDGVLVLTTTPPASTIGIEVHR